MNIYSVIYSAFCRILDYELPSVSPPILFISLCGALVKQFHREDDLFRFCVMVFDPPKQQPGGRGSKGMVFCAEYTGKRRQVLEETSQVVEADGSLPALNTDLRSMEHFRFRCLTARKQWPG